MQADKLRERFLSFFAARKHKIAESDSLVPKDDPTVLFTPAGMNQFKKEFLGFDSGFKRAATSQRCLRTDDLDKVGITPYHHTFFEMLGNFSFGDYFKKEAIQWAWEFLTEELEIKKEKLWVSVYKDDEETYKIWQDLIGVARNKIVKLGDKENFWPSEAKTKGPNGPCGPCSEIFFDFGEGTGCGRKDCSPACDCGRFSEVWNLVFTQFNRKVGGVLEPLPQKNIDTGMGLERLAAVMQGARDNFETDLFRPIIKEIAANAIRSLNLKSPDIYAIADHIRAIVFAIYDGVMPSNEGRGYVIRKIIRRSALHLEGIVIKRPFLYKLVPVVAQIMKKPYPQLVQRQEDIAQIILAEEKNFISTLESSKSLFEDKFKELLKKQDPEKAGIIAFQLYDTYGIPFELTKNWADQNGIRISSDKFDKELKEQKTRSKLKSSMKGDVFDTRGLKLEAGETKFTGYKEKVSAAKIIGIVKNNTLLQKIIKDDAAWIILDKTPFYPESGGQVADIGLIIKGKNKFRVLDTKYIGKAIIHIGQVLEGAFKNNDAVQAKIDAEHRLSIARNHTATHLLQAALRKILGPHVQQQGSLVAAERLRFDFTHFKDVTDEEIKRIEEEVNSYILNNYPLEVKSTGLNEARKQGALAFFAEKYGAKVRTVKIADVSLELCGGTHLENTSGIGLFRIVQESSVASGIRRIEALTGKLAYQKAQEEESIIGEIASFLNVPVQRISQELQERLAQLKSLEKKLEAQKENIARGYVDTLIRDAENVNNIKFIAKVIEGADANLLRKTVDLVKEKVDNSVIALGLAQEGRAFLVVGITADLVKKNLAASKIIAPAAKTLGGNAGGRPDFAQAGGNKPENFAQAFQGLRKIIADSRPS